MDEADASHGVSELLNRFIAIQLRGSNSVEAKARLKRTAFTLLLGLDKDEEVTFRLGFLEQTASFVAARRSQVGSRDVGVVQDI